MKKIDFSYLKDKVCELVLGFPLEVMACILAYVLYVVDYNSYHNNMALIPLVFSAMYAVNNITRRIGGRSRWGYYATALLLAVAMVVPAGHFVGSVGYIWGLLLAVMALLLSEDGSDDRSVASNFVTIMLAPVCGGVIALALMMAFAAIYFSVCYIFGFSEGKWFEYVGVFMWIVVMPCASLMAVLSLRGLQLPRTRFVDILCNYIFGSGVIIYTAVLYVYLLKILLTFTLPVGGITSLVTAFYITAFAWLLLHKKVPNRFYHWYARYFGYFTLPLLVLFAVSLLYRIGQYGFTMSRVYMLLAGVVMAGGSAVMIFVRRRRFAIILYSAVVLIVLSTYVPYVSADAIAVRSQRARLEALAREAGVYDDATGRIKWKNDAGEISDAYAEMVAAYRYVAENTSYAEAEKRYGKCEVDDYSRSLSGSWENDYDINVGEYTVLVNDKSYKVESDANTIEVLIDEKVVLKAALRLPKGDYEGNLPDSSFVYSNDRYMLILSHITRYNDGMVSTYGDYILMKKPLPEKAE